MYLDCFRWPHFPLLRFLEQPPYLFCFDFEIGNDFETTKDDFDDFSLLHFPFPRLALEIDELELSSRLFVSTDSSFEILISFALQQQQIGSDFLLEFCCFEAMSFLDSLNVFYCRDSRQIEMLFFYHQFYLDSFPDLKWGYVTSIVSSFLDDLGSVFRTFHMSLLGFLFRQALPKSDFYRTPRSEVDCDAFAPTF